MLQNIDCKFHLKFIAVIVFIFTAFGFFLAILASNKVLDDGVFLVFHKNAQVSTEYHVGSESPAILCLVASIFYCICYAASLNVNLAERAELGLKITDGITTPLLLCALAMMNDLLHIIFMVSCYVILQLQIEFLSKQEIVKRPSISHVTGLIAFAAFWIGYFVSIGFNRGHTHTGRFIAQFTSLGFFVYHAWKLHKNGKPSVHDALIQFILVFVVLISVFIEELLP